MASKMFRLFFTGPALILSVFLKRYSLIGKSATSPLHEGRQRYAQDSTDCPGYASPFHRRQRHAIWLSITGGKEMMLFTILAVTIPAAILNGNGVKVSFPTCVLNAMQCFAGVGAFFPSQDCSCISLCP